MSQYVQYTGLILDWLTKKICILKYTNKYSQLHKLILGPLLSICVTWHFLQFSKVMSKTQSKIQQLCRCLVFSKIRPKSHYSHGVTVLVFDHLLHNFWAHLWSLVPQHTLPKSKKLSFFFFFLIDPMQLDKTFLTYYEELPNCWKGIWLKDSH